MMEPKRWMEGGEGVPPLATAALATAAPPVVPSAAALARSAAFVARLSATGATAAASPWYAIGRWVLGLGSGLSLVAIGIRLAAPPPTIVPPQRVAVSVVATVSPPILERDLAESALRPPSAALAAPTVPATPVRTTEPAASTVARAHPDEMVLLQQALGAFTTNNPVRALQHTDRMVRWYRTGRFVEERERIGIWALHALGRQREARARGLVLLTEHPHSLYSGEVRRLID